MTQALATRVAQTADTLDLQSLGRVFAESGYFTDARDASKAIVKILYGREMGIAPVTAMMGLHIISGKPVPSAGLLASRIRSSKRYDYRIKQLDNETCTLQFIDSGQVVGESTFTKADADAAGVTTGPNAKTWKSFPRNMLFARALSNGARWYTPDLFGGPVYTAEELGATVNAEGDVIEGSFTETQSSESGSAPTEDPAEREKAMRAWLTASEQATALGIEHKQFNPDETPTVKISRWAGALQARVDEERAKQPAPPTEAEKAAPRDPATGEIFDESPLLDDVDRRSKAWTRNRELTARASELKLDGVKTLGQRSPTETLEQENDRLAERIRDRELDQQLAAEQSAARA